MPVVDGVRQQPTKESIDDAMYFLDKPMLDSVWEASLLEAANQVTGKTKNNVYTSYIKNIAMPNYYTLTYRDSDNYTGGMYSLDDIAENALPKDQEIINQFEKNKNDTLRLLGYLPFEKEVPIHFNTSLINIEKEEDYYKVFTTNNVYLTRCVLLTTGNGGFTPRPLEILGADQISNLSYFVTDVEKFRNKIVLILGGGDSALDYGNMLNGVAKQTHIIHRRNEFRALEDSIEKFKTHGFIHTPYTPSKLKINVL